jgi:hypothetical protein
MYKYMHMHISIYISYLFGEDDMLLRSHTLSYTRLASLGDNISATFPILTMHDHRTNIQMPHIANTGCFICFYYDMHIRIASP